MIEKYLWTNVRYMNGSSLRARMDFHFFSHWQELKVVGWNSKEFLSRDIDLPVTFKHDFFFSKTQFLVSNNRFNNAIFVHYRTSL